MSESYHTECLRGRLETVRGDEGDREIQCENLVQGKKKTGLLWGGQNLNDCGVRSLPQARIREKEEHRGKRTATAYRDWTGNKRTTYTGVVEEWK